MITVRWDKSEIRVHGKSGKRQTFVECECGACGRVFQLRPCDARRSIKRGSNCRICHQVEAGRKGYQATIARHSRMDMLNRIAQTQRAHPTKPESCVAAWIGEVGYVFTSQVVFSAGDDRFIIDFQVENPDVFAQDVAIEVNGYHHNRFGATRDAKLMSAWPSDSLIFVDANRVMLVPAVAKAALLMGIKAALIGATAFDVLA